MKIENLLSFKMLSFLLISTLLFSSCKDDGEIIEPTVPLELKNYRFTITLNRALEENDNLSIILTGQGTHDPLDESIKTFKKVGTPDVYLNNRVYLHSTNFWKDNQTYIIESAVPLRHIDLSLFVQTNAHPNSDSEAKDLILSYKVEVNGIVKVNVENYLLSNQTVKQYENNHHL